MENRLEILRNEIDKIIFNEKSEHIRISLICMALHDFVHC